MRHLLFKTNPRSHSNDMLPTLPSDHGQGLAYAAFISGAECWGGEVGGGTEVYKE